MNRRHLVTAALAAGLAFALPAVAQSPTGYHTMSPPQATDSPDKIEVLEFFSYTCIHCANVHPAAKQWAGRQPADVVFKRIPVVFDPRQEPTARLFYALEATGDLAKLDDAVFTAIHVQKLHMMTDKAALDWVAGQGVDMKKFEAAYRSFGVQSKVRRGVELSQKYKVASTPTFFVNGKYRIETTEPSGYGRMFGIIDELVGRERPAKARGIRG